MKEKKNNNSAKGIFLKNKKAFLNYDIIDKILAGVVLLGTEVKSIRNMNVNFNDSYCLFVKNELWIKNLHISEYENSSFNKEYNPTRDRKLLITKDQIRKFQRKIDEKGLTIVPLNIFINDDGVIKMEIALAKGKKEFDKRNDIGDREAKKKLDRILKNYI